MTDDAYEVVIGLEVHAQLLTKTKLFCADTTAFGLPANTQVSAISLGHPGTLPRMNKEAIRLAITLGLATQSDIVQHNYFARKNYFYPDLPKGYQISQHTTPICRGGFVEITVGGIKKQLQLNRIHIEEDAGKSLHDGSGAYTQLDYNRAGMPLLEIVTEPVMHSADEAAAYVTELRKLVRRLQVCDGNMEEGSLRCDVNISVRPVGDAELGTKVEIKNLNSIRFIKKAIEAESAELIKKHKAGETILQQTKGLDEGTFTTYVIRTKENEDDYRYFPEPDLPPFVITAKEIAAIRQAMPPLQADVEAELVSRFGLSGYDAAQLSDEQDLTEIYLAAAQQTTHYKAVANWVLGPVKSVFADAGLPAGLKPVLPQKLAELIALIDGGVLSFGIASQRVFPQVVAHPETDIPSFIAAEGLQLQAAGDTEALIDEALSVHAGKIAEYKKGKKGLLSLFVGEVMKRSKGKANAEEVTKKLIEKLNTA